MKTWIVCLRCLIISCHNAAWSIFGPFGQLSYREWNNKYRFAVVWFENVVNDLWTHWLLLVLTPAFIDAHTFEQLHSHSSSLLSDADIEFHRLPLYFWQRWERDSLQVWVQHGGFLWLGMKAGESVRKVAPTHKHPHVAANQSYRQAKGERPQVCVVTTGCSNRR